MATDTVDISKINFKFNSLLLHYQSVHRNCIRNVHRNNRIRNKTKNYIILTLAFNLRRKPHFFSSNVSVSFFWLNTLTNSNFTPISSRDDAYLQKPVTPPPLSRLGILLFISWYWQCNQKEKHQVLPGFYLKEESHSPNAFWGDMAPQEILDNH